MRWLVLVVLGLLGGCREETPPPAARVGLAPPDTTPQLGEPWKQPLSSPVAFDLRWTLHGAFLAWARPDGSHRRLEGVLFDATGRPGPPIALDRTDADVVEVAVGYAAPVDRLGVAWVQRRAGEQPQLRGVSNDGTPGHFAPAVSLGPTHLAHVGERGHLAVAGRDSLRVYARGDDQPCEDGKAPICASFGAHPLPPDPGSRRPWLTVPRPCDRPVAGYVLMAPHRYYGVCHLRDDGRPETVWFSIQPEPMYAQAHELLAGCEPRGAATLGSAVWVTASCGSVRTGVRFRGIDVGSPQRIDDAELRCEPQGSPILELDGDHRLVAPADHLAPLLPAQVAGTDSAAVWTGEVLLVARHVARQIEVARYRCVEGLFVREG